MFQIDDDMTIYITRGDIAYFSVMAENNGMKYKFQPGDVVRMKVTAKKDCTNVAFQKDFAVIKESEKVDILLTEEETKIGDVISKPVDYWYEIELNPYTNPQTIVGYDDDGAKIFKLFPEGKDLGPNTEPEDVPVVDNELSLTSDRPVQNQAIARAMTQLTEDIKATKESGTKAVTTLEEKTTEATNRAFALVGELGNDLAVERARINNLAVLKEGSTTGDAELADIRVGADGKTYENAGEAVRGQVSNLKSDLSNIADDLESEQDEGIFHRYLTWEHGGIDSANGIDNNEGSLTRSRTPEYFLCADYEKITNSSAEWGYIIYYDANKVYKYTDAVTLEHPVNVDKSYIYFRLDLRSGIDTTTKIKAYQKTRISKIEDNIHEERYEQIYFLEDYGIVEEDTANKKVYFGAINPLCVRYGVSGNIKTAITIASSDLASELDTVLSTSPNGVENCVVIEDLHALVYDTQSKSFAMVHRYDITKNHIVIVAQCDGFVTSANSYFIRKIVNSNNEATRATIPSYWDTAINEAEASINDALSSDEFSASFAFVTDTHIGINQGYSGALMEKVMRDCHIPVWFHGGDAVTGSSVITKENLIAEMNADFKQFASIESIGLRAIGNHDVAFGTESYNHNLTNGETNHYYHGVDREKYLQIHGKKKGYFYKDIHKDNLRCIVLDIIPFESQVDNTGFVNGSNKIWYHQFGSEQLEWFASVLADTPKNYSVVVCSHIAPVSLTELQTLDENWSESVPVDYVQARKIAEAYAIKASYSFIGNITGDTTGDTYNISADFTDAQGDFVCWFCGHTHKDFIMNLDNINFVGTANDSFYVSVNAPSYAPSKTAGTNTEHVIDFFCINKTKKVVSVVRLGAYLESNGKVRTFNYV